MEDSHQFVNKLLDEIFTFFGVTVGLSYLRWKVLTTNQLYLILKWNDELVTFALFDAL